MGNWTTMTNRTDHPAAPQSEVLLAQLRELKNASTFKRGEEAVRFAAMTIAVIRGLETRLNELEDAANGKA